MKPKILSTSGCIALLCAALVSTATAGDPAIEKALRDLDAQWSAAAAAKDVDKTVSFYAKNAVVLPPNAPLAATPEAIRAQWQKDIDSMVGGGWKPTRVEVAQSSDMAWVTGTYTFDFKDASGKTVNDRGHYLEVWQKQADGSWKCTADAWNSELPASTRRR